MAKTKEQPVVSTRFDADMLARFAAKIAAEGFVPAEMLRAEFGDSAFTQSIAILYRTYRILRETRRSWNGAENVLGYEIGDHRHSRAEMKRIPNELGFVLELMKSKSIRYRDWEEIEVRCRWTTRVLGAKPTTDDTGDQLNVFDRDEAGDVFIPAYCLRAMAVKALPIIDKEAAIGHRIHFSSVKIHAPTIKIFLDPVIDPHRREGLGIKRSEIMPPGQEFTIRAVIPTSVLSRADFIRMLTIAGEYVRLSPARSAGYGEFVVIV